jgi:uncharacterized membrane protein
VSRVLLAISLLAVVGMVLSAVSLKNHYSGEKTEYCDLGENFNCDLVNRSVYSRVGPVPVAAIGLVGYAVLFALSRISLSRRRATRTLMLSAALVGLAFCLYLTYIEAYVLAVWCILCLGSLATILGITVLAAVAVAKSTAM